jgi:hypothetical protein
MKFFRDSKFKKEIMLTLCTKYTYSGVQMGAFSDRILVSKVKKITLKQIKRNANYNSEQ